MSTAHEPLQSAVERADAALANLNGVQHVTYPALDALPGVHALTTLRVTGPTHRRHDEPTEQLDRMAPWLATALASPGAGVAAGRQVHNDRSIIISSDSRPKPRAVCRFDDTDALLTRERHVVLVVLTADCLPVFLADAETGAIAVVHAGKVGTRKEIALKAARAFIDELGADPKHTTAVIGPSIGDGCYPQRLWEANEQQLRQAGIGTIVNPRICTRCNLQNCYSYRAEKGFTGRMLSAIILADA